jgi:hypothetical protein
MCTGDLDKLEGEKLIGSPLQLGRIRSKNHIAINGKTLKESLKENK